MKGFKNFIMQGNLVEMAVAFIIGASFATVVKSFTTMLMDLIGKAFKTPSFSNWVPGGVHVGDFITQFIAFLLVAFVVYFFVVKPYEAAKAKLVKPVDEAATTESLLAEIRDELRKH